MSCIYLKFQDQKLLSHHVIAVCKNQTLNLKDYTSQFYLMNTYYNIYSKDYAFDLIRIEDLKSLLF